MTSLRARPDLKSPALLLILLLALLLRLAYALAQPAAIVPGGDSAWYLRAGYDLMTGFDFSQIPLPTAPLYLVFIGLAQRIFDPAGAIIAIRILQCLLSSFTVACAYVLAYRVAPAQQAHRAGLIAAAMLAIAPVFIIESAQILTETLYVACIAGGMAAYVEALARLQRVSDKNTPEKGAWIWLALAGLGFGLATLTRAASLLFPLGLALHLLIVLGLRRGLKALTLLLLVYSLVALTWTFHNRVYWGRWVLGADNFSAFLFVGATQWEDPAQVDANVEAILGEEVGTSHAERQGAYLQGAAAVIQADIPAYIAGQLGKLAESVLMPHGTLLFGGESLRDLALSWLREDRSPAGLIRLTQADDFWPKLVLYIGHYAALLLGILGIWQTRRQWRYSLAYLGFIAYTLLLHMILLALPRYIFPLMIFFWAYASVVLLRLWPDRAQSVSGAASVTSGTQPGGPSGG